MSETDSIYAFEIGEYAESVEIYGNKRAPDTRRAFMDIREDEALELVEAILTEIES